MKETRLSLPELALVGGTRAIFGLGVGLLLANRLSAAQRRPLGLALLAIGALTTIPLGLEVLSRSRLIPSGK
jgi:hypothetical protein